MRPPRVVLISAIVMSGMMASSATARPRLPALFGAVLGTVGGMVGLHHRHAVRHARHSERHYASAPAERPADGGNTGVQTGSEAPASPSPATAAQISGPVAPAELFWPQLADDLFDYVLWPSGKDDHFWAHGYDEVVEGALRPANRRADRSAAARHGAAPNAVASGTGAAPSTCAGRGSESADRTMARIEETIRPTDAERAALADLKTAVQRGFEYIDTTCPSARPQTPTARLDDMEDRIWAARQALLITRAPFAKLYAALDDEQKARLNGTTGEPAARGAGCSERHIDLATALTGGRLRPAPTQRPGLEALRTTSDALAKLLASSCPGALPGTPLERLDAADRRLNSLLYAVVTLRAPLDGFYASLSDQQKMQLSGLKR